MQWAKRLALGTVAGLVGIAMVACGNGPVVIQAILAEQATGPSAPPIGHGILAIQNDSDESPVTCLLIREHSGDPTAANPWGSNRLTRSVAPGRQEQLTLEEGLYDIAVLRPSLLFQDGEETDLNPAFLISEATIHIITVNDFSFADIEPQTCTSTAGAGGMGT